MSKFKVGDIVVGNAGASSVYQLTKEGCVLEVVTAGCSTFGARLVKNSLFAKEEREIGHKFPYLAYSLFNLQVSPTQVKTSQSTDELIAENVSLKTQIASLVERLATKRGYLASNLSTIQSRVETAS